MSPVKNSRTQAKPRSKPAGKASKNKAKDRATRRWIAGFVALFVSLYLFLSVTSYFFNWKADQSALTDGGETLNRGGKLGARLGEWIVADAFGVFGVLIPILLIILSLRVLRYKPVFLRRSVPIGLMALILGSVTLGYIGLFSDGPGAFGTGLGGKQGVYIAQWLDGYLSFGTALLLLVLIVMLAVYINRSTIALINRVGQGVADTTVSVANNVTDYIAQQREARLLIDPEEEPEEETEEPPVENASIPGESGDTTTSGFFSRLFSKRTPHASPEEGSEAAGTLSAASVDYDYSYAADALEPVAPIVPPTPLRPAVVRKVSILPDEDDFVVRTTSDDSDKPVERQLPRVPITDKWEDGKSYREMVDADGFIVREVIKDMDDVLDVLDETDAEEEELYSELDAALSTTRPEEEDRPIRIDENFTVRIAREEELLPDEMVDTGFYDHTLDLPHYQRPPVELLEDHHIPVSVTEEELRQNKNKIKVTLENFGIRIDKIEATVGPTVTLYEIIPAPGVRISKIKNLENDIALSLSALGIRIIAPIPGKGTIGIEVPNQHKQIVSMYSVIKSPKFRDADYDLPVVLGRTIQNECYTIDLAKMPHLLVAGATGQGKSVGLNAIITSLLYKKHPSEVKFVMVDPKKVELTVYGRLEKHFLAKMSSEEEAIITDTQKVVNTLNSLCIEMDARYDLLKNAGVRNLKEYNAKFAARRLNPNKGHRYLPYIVVIIDEYADLLVTAGREIETPLARIAQLARAVGIHLIIATQRPTADVITGLIKANIPARIAFRVTSMMNSRTILDHPGAEQLIGRGDMLVQTGGEITRVQCAFMDTPESERIMEYISNQRGYSEPYELPDYVPEGESGAPDADLTRRDSLFEEAARLIVTEQQGSTSLIQRKFAIGYNRAGRIMDQLELAGIVGRAQGSKPREVKIVDLLQLDQMLEQIDRFH
jgi:S-DNA-T family DNA segregation ATPase FtsK/SpoIIIE